MVSRNNIQERIRKIEEKRERHSIRKFAVGAASVLIGLSFMGMSNQTAKADTIGETEVATEQTMSVEKTEQTINSRYGSSQDKVNNINSTINKDLENAADEASKVDGVTVNKKDPNKVNTTVNDIDKNKLEIDKNNQAQIDEISAKLNKHKEELKKYNKARDEYIQKLKDLGLWNDGEHIDPDSLSQLLILGKETDAEVNAESLHNKVTKGDGKLLNGLLDKHWKVAESIKGDFLKVTYTNLRNSFYANKPISKIVITFSDFDKSSGESGIYFGNCPTNGFFYNKCTGVTMKMELFDVDGNLITLGDNTAYITVGSLNSKGSGSNYIEMAQLLGNGHGIALPESSVTVHPGNILYSDKNNELLYKKDISDADRKAAIAIWGEEIVNKYLGWDDSVDRSHEIFGSGLFQVSGNDIKIRFSNQLGSAWATYSTTVPKLAFDQEKPKLEIDFVPSELVLNKNSNVHIHYVDVHEEAKKGTTDFIPEHGIELTEQLQSIKHLAVGDSYSNNLWDWTTAGYILATEETHPNATAGTILDDDQHFYVYLKKATEEVTRDKVVNQTIHYVYEDGTTAAPDHVSQKLVFTQTGVKDMATGETNWNGEWTEPQRFVTVVSPTIKGYHTDRPEVGPYKITVDNSNFDQNLDKEDTVVYKANPTETVNRDKEVNQIIHYVYEDGTTAAPDHVSVKLIFTQTGIKDTITGETIWNGEWTETQRFVVVVSPIIEGFTADRLEVGPYEITVDNSNFDQNLDKEDTVVYIKNPSQPTDPQPTQPTQPSKPEEQPTDPTTPEEPSNPTTPTTPEEQPTDPTTPEEPSNPTTPTTPEEEPTNPTTPEEQPTTPTLPDEIVTPKPEEPVEPETPTEDEEIDDDILDEPIEEENVTPQPETPVIKKTAVKAAKKNIKTEVQQAQNNEQLPETGETKKSSIFGLAAIALGSLIGLAGTRKRKNK